MTDMPTRLAPGVDRMSGAPSSSAPKPTIAGGDAAAASQVDEDAGMQQLRRQAAHGTLDVVARGLDPLTTTPRIGGPIPWQLEAERRFMFESQRHRQMNEAVFLNPQSGWGEIQQFMKGVFDRYKAQNESTLIKKPRNQEEAMLQMEQLKPVTVDPTEMANIRQKAVQLDQLMKSVDPRTSFWTDPRTKKYADWINREAGGGGVGYLTSGEQKLETGVTGALTQPIVEAAEGATGAVADLLVGGWDLGRQAVQALGGPDMGSLVPTNYIEGPDGKLYDNGAKVPSLVDGMVMMWASATGRNVERAVAEMGRTREMEIASRNGFEHVVNAAARIAGIGIGMGGPAGGAMKGGASLFGTLTEKGLAALGGLRLASGAVQSERAVKIIRALAGGIGAAAGNGAYEAAAYGRLDGYGHSFMHGMAMAPVLTAIGAMGRRTEWLAHHRANMPEGVAKMVGAAMEGAGFGALEHLAPQLLPSAWGFIKNPSEETWQTYANNAAGMMLMSMAMRGRRATPGSTAYDAVTEQVQRGQQRSQFAERVAQGKATPEELAKAPSDQIDLEQLGQLQMASRSPDPAVRERANTERAQLESQIDQRETKVDKGPSERVVAGAKAEIERAMEGLTPEQFLEKSKAEMRTLREAIMTQGKWTPEQRARFNALMDVVNMRNWKRMGEGVSKIHESIRESHEDVIATKREMIEAGEVVKSLLPGFGSASDVRAEMNKRGANVPPTRTAREQAMLEDQKRLVERVKGKPAGEVPKPDWMPQEDYDGLAAMAKKAGMPLQELIADAAKDAGKPVPEVAAEGPPTSEGAAAAEGDITEVGIFAGESAKRAPKTKLKQAREMLASGADPEQVRKETGWSKGADDRMKFEIDDSASKLVDSIADLKESGTFQDLHRRSQQEGKPLTLSSVLDHPELFKKYPELSEMSILLEDKPNFAASYRTRQMSLMGRVLSPGAIAVSPGVPIKKLRSALLHEIQHAVQDIEHFSGGADPARPDYMRVMGEVEARNVQKRRNMTAEERAAVSPESTEDTPRLEQVPYADAGEAGMAGPTEVAARSQQFRPTRQVEPTEGVQPIRASDVILEMQGRPGDKGFRIPFTSTRIGGTEGDPVRPAIREGHINSRNTLGLFKLYENTIRNKDARDLATAAHEWSHAMHRHMLGESGGKDFVKAVKQQLASLPKEVAAELPMMAEGYAGYDKLPAASKMMESWAEWHARNLLGDPELDTRTPHASAWMRAWLAKPEQAAMRQQYQRIQEMLYRYNAQGSEARVRQSIVLETDPETESQRAQKPSIAQRAMDTVTKAFFDDMVDMKRAQDRVLEAANRKPEDVAITDDPARLFDALRMTAGKQAEHYIMQGIRMPDGSHVPGLREVLKPHIDKVDDLYKYLVSVRSLELQGRGKKTQLPAADYAETMKRVSERNPGVVEAAAGIKRWTDALVDIVASAGSIDAKTADALKQTYSLYIPFFRAMEGPRAHGQGRGVAERGSGLSRIQGSTLEVRDPLVALQEVAQTLIAKAHQNQVMSALYKMALGQEAGGLATVIPKAKVPHDHPARQVIDALEKAVQDDLAELGGFGEMFKALREMDKVGAMDAVTLFTQKTVPTGERSVIAFTPRLTPAEMDSLVQSGANRWLLEKQNNKLQWLEVDPKVYEALMGIDKMPQLPESMQPIMKVLQAPRDMVRFFATGVNPGFVAANLVRDALSKPLFDREGKFRPFGGFVDVIRGAIEYHKNGEMRQLYEELGVKTSSFFNEGVRREVAGQTAGFRTKFLEVTSRMQEFFSHPENYLRMAAFKDALTAARAAGKPEAQARLEALESGKELMNFSRAGIVSRALNQMIPYFNAGLVGKRKFFGQLLWGGDVKGDEAKARVQRATLLNGLASITMPSIALWLLNKDEDWYQDLPEWRRVNYWNVKIGEDILSIPKPFEAGVIFGTLPEKILDEQLPKANPVQMGEIAKTALGSYMEGVGSFLPAFLRPIIEVDTNYDFFRRRELTPDWVSRSMPPDEQMTTYTTASARILSKAIGGVLTPIEVEHLLGGYTAGATTRAMRFLDEVSGLKDHPLGSPMPWDRFFSQTPHGSSSYVDQLYKMGADLEQRDDSLTGQERGLANMVDAAKKRISDLRKMVKAGKMAKADAERRAYELARPLVERSR